MSADPDAPIAGQLRQRPGDQPLPTGATTEPGAHDRIIELMQQRRALGLARYGSTLQPHNGRNTAQDLVDELADGIVYAQTLGTELADLEEALRRVVMDWVPDCQAPDCACSAHAARALLAQRGAL